MHSQSLAAGERRSPGGREPLCTLVLSVQTGYGGARSAPGNIILRGGQKDNRAMQSLKRSIFFSTNSESAQIASTVSLYKLSENV